MEEIAVLFLILQHVCMISPSTSVPEISVKWKVLTSPVVFGETVILECKVTRNVEHKYQFEWTGGKDNTILCRGPICSDGKKYNMITDQKENKSQLEILDFMESDLDYEYTCAYEYETHSKMLTLELLEFNIIKPPINDASLESVFIEDGFLFVTKTLENVYPKPICFVNLMYLSKNAFSEQLLNVSTSQNGLFFNAYLEGQFKVPCDICKGKSEISCDFGPKKYPVSIVEIDNCTSQANNDNIMSDVKSTSGKCALAIGLLVSSILVSMAGICACVHFKNKRQRSANIDEDEDEDDESKSVTITKTPETVKVLGEYELMYGHTTRRVGYTRSVRRVQVPVFPDEL